ncbi:hypothetical protein ACJX0J_016388, partial [Zea mays]
MTPHNNNMTVAIIEIVYDLPYLVDKKIYVGHHVKWTHFNEDNIIPDIIVAYDEYCGLQAQILTLQITTTNNALGNSAVRGKTEICDIILTIKGIEVHFAFIKNLNLFTSGLFAHDVLKLKHTLVNVIFVIVVTRTETKI